MNYTKQSNNKKQKTNKSKNKKIKSKISIVIFKIILVAIIIGIFALGGAGLGAMTGIIKNAPPIEDVLISLKPTLIKSGTLTHYTFQVCPGTSKGICKAVNGLDDVLWLLHSRHE